jgi:hypothetical protein
MKFFERMFSASKETIESAKDVHSAFTLTDDNFWFSNRSYKSYEEQPTLKATFKFDTPELLDDCPFMAKIGMNESEGPKYFGVAYATESNQSELETWAKRFPWAHLIIGLDNDGVITDISQEIDLKEGI